MVGGAGDFSAAGVGGVGAVAWGVAGGGTGWATVGSAAGGLVVEFTSPDTTKGRRKHDNHADNQNFIGSKVGPEGFALKGKSARCAQRGCTYGRAP